MAFENIDVDNGENGSEAAPPSPTGAASNRTFIIAAGGLGGLTLLALLFIAAYAGLIMPRQRASRQNQLALLNAQNTQVAQAITQTSAAAQATAAVTPTFTPTATQPPSTATPTATPVVLLPTNTVQPTADPRTATVAALLTQAAVTTRTVVPTPTALPNAGFADDVGLPAMMGLAVLLLGMIFLARKLRTA